MKNMDAALALSQGHSECFVNGHFLFAYVNMHLIQPAWGKPSLVLIWNSFSSNPNPVVY